MSQTTVLLAGDHGVGRAGRGHQVLGLADLLGEQLYG